MRKERHELKKTIIKPIKNLTFGVNVSSGRGCQGNITFFHRGGGHKRLYRVIDHKRTSDEYKGTIVRMEYDPFRSAFVALVCYDNGALSYVIACSGFYTGLRIGSGLYGRMRWGDCQLLRYMEKGYLLHNVGMERGRAGTFARSAGTYAVFLKKYNDHVVLRMPSGEQRAFFLDCKAILGSVSNSKHRDIRLTKAGQSRHLNRRPVVRGVAMNPVDHPHGGGEGKSSPTRCALSPWGRPTKGTRTRSPIKDKENRFIIVSRRFKKRGRK